MNRPLKFRVWDADLNKFGNPDIYGFILRYGLIHGSEKHTEYDIYYDPNVVLQQYTGLNDKDGKEIYEGDIIIDTQCQKYEIIFDENHARYDLKVCGENKLSQTSYGTKIYEKKHIEVIGNIFEHSELLK